MCERMDNIKKRWTPASMCESPGCGEVRGMGPIRRPHIEKGLHLASYAVHSRSGTHVLTNPATAELGALTTKQGMLLCPCCLATLVKRAKEAHMPIAMLHMERASVGPGRKIEQKCLARAMSVMDSVAQTPASLDLDNLPPNAVAINLDDLKAVMKAGGKEAAAKFLAQHILAGMGNDAFADLMKNEEPSIEGEEIIDLHDAMKSDDFKLPDDIRKHLN